MNSLLPLFYRRNGKPAENSRLVYQVGAPGFSPVKKADK